MRVTDLLSKDVIDADGETLIDAVGDLDDGGVIVGNAVIVIERVAGFEGVCVKLLRGDLVICGVRDILILGEDDMLGVIVDVTEDDGVIVPVAEGVGVEEGGKYI